MDKLESTRLQVQALLNNVSRILDCHPGIGAYIIATVVPIDHDGENHVMNITAVKGAPENLYPLADTVRSNIGDELPDGYQCHTELLDKWEG